MIDLTSVVETAAAAGITAILISLASVRGIRHIVAEDTKRISADKIFAELGFKNFKVKDLNDVSDQGFAKLIVLVRELKQSSAIPGLTGMPSTGLSKQILDLQGLIATAQNFPGTAKAKKPESGGPIIGEGIPSVE